MVIHLFWMVEWTLDKSSIKVYALKFNNLYIFMLFQNLERQGFYILKMT